VWVCVLWVCGCVSVGVRVWVCYVGVWVGMCRRDCVAVGVCVCVVVCECGYVWILECFGM
jgi:hypothetical protein